MESEHESTNSRDTECWGWVWLWQSALELHLTIQPSPSCVTGLTWTLMALHTPWCPGLSTHLDAQVYGLILFIFSHTTTQNIQSRVNKHRTSSMISIDLCPSLLPLTFHGVMMLSSASIFIVPDTSECKSHKSEGWSSNKIRSETRGHWWCLRLANFWWW